jgi:hypothetical protein
LSYIIGTQILLLLVAYIVDSKFGIAGWLIVAGYDEAARLAWSLPSLVVEHKQWSDPLWLNILDFSMLILIALLPFPIIRCLLRRRRSLWVFNNLRLSPLLFVFITVLVVTTVNVISGLSLFAARFTQEELRPIEPPPYVISNNSLECSIISRGNEFFLASTMIVTVTGKDPWLFASNDCRVSVSAERTASDPPDPRRIARTLTTKPHFSNLNDNKSARTFVERGRSAVIDLETGIDPDTRVFLDSHKAERRCTVDDANDNEVGAVAPITPM